MSLEAVLKKNPIVPVVKADTVDEALKIIAQLKAKNISIAEFTLRTPNAFKVLTEILAMDLDMTIGIGTILSVDQMLSCHDIGAKFLVSPGATQSLLETAKANSINYLPGAVTPTEIMTAREYGFKILKFFPAEAMGGINLLKNYQAVFPDITFCATGGIKDHNQNDYLNLSNIIAIGSSAVI
jgi:2-dehydro-3-deoxyphosphogluconate aldolase/(4S)-4-hydroxy-2-oxoglutarate aldolase